MGSTNIADNQAEITTDGTSSVGTSASTVLTANVNRKFLAITNNHASQVIYIRFGDTATTSAGIQLAAGQSLVLDRVVPTGLVSVIASGAATTTFFAEGE